MTCKHCANDVPDGVFCTSCGAQQATTATGGDAKARLGHFAAHPGEHVLHPGVFTTLLPHLGQDKVHQFRWAFIVGLACIFVLYLVGLIPSALLAAAFFIPVLYLIYLYEAQVYRDEPAAVLGFTIGGGIIVGLIVTVLTVKFTNPVALSAPGGGSVATLVILTIVLPVVQELVKPLPALVVRTRPGFTETVDGLVLGVAAGLGFSLAETVIRFSSVITGLPARTATANWIYPLLTLAVLLPLLQGSCTGAITAALWRLSRGRATAREVGAIVLAFLAHVAFVLLSYLTQNAAFTPLVILAWQAAVVGALVIYIRYVLHHALLEEAAHMGFAQTMCPNCQRHIVAAGFCPNCGKALNAAPIQVTVARAPRPAVTAPTPEQAATSTEGTYMPFTCPNCGTQNPEGNAFCASCGKPLPTAAPPPEAGAPPPPALPPPGGTVLPGGGVPPPYQWPYAQGSYPPQPPYQSPYYVPAGEPPQPVHKTHWLAIVGAIVGTLGALTAVALIVAHPHPCTDLRARACVPPPPPVLRTATLSSGGGGQTISTNTFSVQLLPGWMLVGKSALDDEVLLTTTDNTVSLSIEARTGFSPPTTPLQQLLRALQDIDQLSRNKGGDGALWCGDQMQGTVGGKTGIMRPVCYTILVPFDGDQLPQEMYSLEWCATNGSGTTAYRFEIATAADQDHINAAFSAAVPVLQTVTWTAT